MHPSWNTNSSNIKRFHFFKLMSNKWCPILQKLISTHLLLRTCLIWWNTLITSRTLRGLSSILEARLTQAIARTCTDIILLLNICISVAMVSLSAIVRNVQMTSKLPLFCCMTLLDAKQCTYREPCTAGIRNGHEKMVEIDDFATGGQFGHQYCLNIALVIFDVNRYLCHRWSICFLGQSHF